MQVEPVFRLIYLVHPKPSHPQYGTVDGAYVTSWVKEPVMAAADLIARESIDREGWDIEEVDEHVLVTDDTCPPGTDGREYFEQVQLDGLVHVFHTWPVGVPDED